MTWDFTLRGVACLTAVLALFGARAAWAADSKTYLGSFCVPEQDGDATRLSIVTGTIVAGGGGSSKIVCPIIKNVTDNAVLEEVALQFWKGSSSEAKCTLSAFRSNVVNQSTSNIVDRVEGTVTGTGTKPMVFNNFLSGKAAPWATNFTYYTLQCTLPSGDRLQHYRVREAGTRTQSAKIYPPAMCRPDLGTNTARYYFQAGNFVDGAKSPGGWLQAAAQSTNPGTGTFSMVCPAVGDISANTTGTALAYISLMPPVTVGKTLTCTLYASDNSLPVDSRSATFTGNGTEFTSQTFNLDLSSGAAWARYHIRCTASDLGDAKILGYRIQEN